MSIIDSLAKAKEQTIPIRIYLAWQTIGDGRRQIRRYSPDLPAKMIKLWEPQNIKALIYLEAVGNPEYPKFALELEPYKTINVTEAQLCKPV